MRKEVDEVNQIGGDALERMHAILHLYRSRQQRSTAGAGGELAHMEFKALGYFARHPGATQSDLVAHSGRDKAQVARLIRALRDRGLLDGAADAQDKRSTRLTLSEQGRAVHAALHRHDGALAGQALAGFDAAERAALLALLDRVRANLEAGAP